MSRFYFKAARSSRLWFSVLVMFGVVSVGLVVASNVVRAQRDSGQGAPEAAAGNESEGDRAADENPAQPPQPETETATFGSGCFWCTEAVFQRVDGVLSVASGYSGGHLPNPTYQQVCTGLTGHAEVIQLTFDPKKVAYDELLEIFWKTHDPTTLNAQGPDHGTQYRSAIFYHNEKQRELAEHYKKKLDEEHAFRDPIVTEITKFTVFYPAEDYHQNYYNNNRRQGYCQQIIRPKLAKFQRVFGEKAKKVEK